jgi:peptidoglycan/xylan/chitin deacetylase (PgdA/CDA1 family)
VGAKMADLSYNVADKGAARQTGSASTAIPFSQWQPWCLAYHEILPVPSEYLYAVSAEQFGRHLTAFSSAVKSRERHFIPKITFDDGHRSVFEYALPLLDHFGLKAVFFVIPAYVGSHDQCISWNQLRKMVAAGHEVQSHGWSHRLLTQCSRRELDIELINSKRELEDRLGMDVKSLSVPGGRYDKDVILACLRAGYTELYHSNPWVPEQTAHGLRLKGRIMVNRRMDVHALSKQMQMSAAQRFYFRARYAAKDRLRAALGDRIYHKLWCSLASWKPGAGIEVRVDNGQT